MSTINNTLKSSGFLNSIERIGNAIPSITILIFYGLLICWGLSFALSFINFDYYHPINGQQIEVVNMLAANELVVFVTSMVKNFVNFPPLGVTIVVTLGIGIAEGSGFLQIIIKKLLNITPKRIVTPAVAFVGVLSHVASDSAYVFLMPMSALIFYAYGRHPLAGIATAFAGLSGGFTASYTPSIVDPLLQGFTQGAAQIIDPSYEVSVLCNYFVGIGGTFGVILACWYVTDKIVEPRLQATMPINSNLDFSSTEELKRITPEENHAFRLAGSVMLVILVLITAMAYPDNSLLRAEDGSLTSMKAPLTQALVPLLFIIFALPGLIYGFKVKKFRNSRDLTRSMESIVNSLVSFIVFSFFCAQFLFVFGRSNIGALIATSGAEFLRHLNMPAAVSIIGILILTGLLNLLITSASSKWAILAPVLVPMLMGVGIAPELTQSAFRISDSTANIITPMFPFYPLIISYCQQYSKQAGAGTLCSMMIPYTVALTLTLTATLFIFWGLGLPLGIDSQYVWPALEK